MLRNVRSKFVAVVLAFAVAAGMTAAQAIVYPDVAQAGVLGKVKGAAKKVGGAVKTAAKNVGGAAKAAGAAGKQVGVGVGRNVKRAAVRVGKEAARTPVVKGIKNAGKVAKMAASKIRKAVR